MARIDQADFLEPLGHKNRTHSGGRTDRALD